MVLLHSGLGSQDIIFCVAWYHDVSREVLYSIKLMTARKVFFLEHKDNYEKDTIAWLVVVTVYVVIADKIRNGQATVCLVPSYYCSTELTRPVRFHQTQTSRTEKTKTFVLTVLPKTATSPILLLTIPLNKLAVFNRQVTCEQGCCPPWLSTVFIAHDPRTRVPSNDDKDHNNSLV